MFNLSSRRQRGDSGCDRLDKCLQALVAHPVAGRPTEGLGSEGEYFASRCFKSNFHIMNITDLSPSQLRRAADLKEKIEALQAELASILGGTAPEAPSQPPSKKLHWTQTPEGKARMARLMKRAWVKRRKG
jgi:hypothetical protein